MNAKQRKQDKKAKVKFLFTMIKPFIEALEDIDSGKATAREHLDKFDELKASIEAQLGVKIK